LSVVQFRKKDLPEIGQQIGVDVIAIKSSGETDTFFRDGGRALFPTTDVGGANFYRFAQENDAKRDETLIQIRSAAKEADDAWLTELENEETRMSKAYEDGVLEATAL